MGFLDDLFRVANKTVKRAGNQVMNAQDDARRLSPEQIASKIEHANISVMTGYGSVLREKYQAMSSSEQSRFMDYIIRNNYNKAYNLIKDL